MAHIKKFEHLKIPLETIRSATNNFANENCIGKGGFGEVYKAEVIHHDIKTLVALKRLDRRLGQGDPEFWKEIIMLSSYKHENIVSLLGYCDDLGEKILVYEYASKKSLDLYLNKGELTWVRRLQICLGAARGLECLHSADGTYQRVLHRDIKSSNILLDENWSAKISDFGLSKFGSANQENSFCISNAVGTPGYCDPAYAETGLLTKESDVYSFGVVLFEVLVGRLCFQNNDKHPSLARLARNSFEQNKLSDIVFANIRDEINPSSLRVFGRIAYQCLNKDGELRPSMFETMRALEAALRCQIDDTYICPDIFEEPTLYRMVPANEGILNVKVLRATNLKSKFYFYSCDPVVSLEILPRVAFSDPTYTTVKCKNENPKWYETFNLSVKSFDGGQLRIVIYDDKKGLLGGETLGWNDLPLKDLTPEETKTLTVDLLDEDDKPLAQCQVMLEVMYRPHSYDKIPIEIEGVERSLKVIIHKGEDLKGNNHTNPSVRVLFRGEEKETKSISRSSSPIWRSEFWYSLEKQKLPINELLHLEVVSTCWMRLIYPEECLGHVDINLTDVINKKRINKTYDLINSKSGCGRLHVELELVTRY